MLYQLSKPARAWIYRFWPYPFLCLLPPDPVCPIQNFHFGHIDCQILSTMPVFVMSSEQTAPLSILGRMRWRAFLSRGWVAMTLLRAYTLGTGNPGFQFQLYHLLATGPGGKSLMSEPLFLIYKMEIIMPTTQCDCGDCMRACKWIKRQLVLLSERQHEPHTENGAKAKDPVLPTSLWLPRSQLTLPGCVSLGCQKR